MYKYFMPVKIFVGEIAENSVELKALGSKALIVTGKSSAKNGSLSDMEAALKKEGINFAVFDKTEENPSLENVEEAAELGKKENVDFVIGVGGGSPMDASKAIALLIKNPGLTGKNLIDGNPYPYLPTVAVPTTAGTGSEATPYAVLTIHHLQTKTSTSQKIFPEIAYLNPKYLENMPREVMLATAVDAFSHLAESYFSAKASYLNDKIIEGGFIGFSECLKELMEDRLAPQTLEKLLVTSTIGGIAISQTGTSLPHGMGYALTYHKKAPHGFANNVFMPGYLNLCGKTMEDKLKRLLDIMGFESGESFGECLKSMTKLKMEISKDEIDKYTAEFFENKAKLKNHPQELTEDDIKSLYYESLKEYIV